MRLLCAEDLMRAGAEQSKAIFILADLDASDITKDQVPPTTHPPTPRASPTP